MVHTWIIRRAIILSLTGAAFGYNGLPMARRNNHASCKYSGTLYFSGQQFADDCNSCSCYNGHVTCTGKYCLGDGKCVHEGIVHLNNTGFHDDCNWCFCSKGSLDCTNHKCPDKDDCLHKGAVYKNGAYIKDECKLCRCIQGRVGCPRRKCRNIKKSDNYVSDQGKTKEPNPIVNTEKKNDDCIYRGHVYSHGSRFKIECNACICLFGDYSCTYKFCGYS